MNIYLPTYQKTGPDAWEVSKNHQQAINERPGDVGFIDLLIITYQGRALDLQFNVFSLLCI